MPDITPQQFVEKWERAELKERASTQEHFMDLCHLAGHPTPAEKDPDGTFFTFEAGGKTTSGGQGYADVWYKDHFAIEYKGKGKYDTLDAAYQQLLKYREYLGNPPLLIVCDIEHWEIHTNFTGTVKKIHRFTNRDIATSTRIQQQLRWLFTDPQRFHPERTAEQVTAEAAGGFKDIADNMRAWNAAPERIAHFLTKLVFCLFAEDVGLLPAGVSGKGLFTEIIDTTRRKPGDFVLYTGQLFRAMAEGGKVNLRDVPYFDGKLFDDVVVEELSAEALNALERACKLDWSAIEPAIFGTLFERSLDPSKRAQLGAHYTSRADILLIVEPVLIQPLRREWDTIQLEAAPLREKYDAALKDGTRAAITRLSGDLLALRERMLHRLRSVTVLDPACGSGNFLYVALQLLKDLEKEVIHHTLWRDLPLAIPEVHPRQLYGIEINPIAHDLASIVVWIGYIQWQQNNGYLSFKEPILEPLDNIKQMDAILAFDAAGNPVEPEWPAVDVIVSNPPFLGGSKIRGELGDYYIEQLWKLYESRVPGFSDLVCYWFERSCAHIKVGKAKRAGLLATNSIRGGVNREVLNRIKQTGDIFMAWADRSWVLEGAAVRVSMVGFDSGKEQEKLLDGVRVSSINSDLTTSIDLTKAQSLSENGNITYSGTKKGGPFDISAQKAQELLLSQNASGKPNSDVVKPWINGTGLLGKPTNTWIIDFGDNRNEQDASRYEAPFLYVKENVYPIRVENRRATRAKYWWLHSEVASGLRKAITGLSRYLATPRVAKYRLFVWVTSNTIPDDGVFIFARSDDYFFGVLHSRIHEKWALRMGTWLGKGNDPRYTPTTTFETFPFPWPPGQEPVMYPPSPTLPPQGGKGAKPLGDSSRWLAGEDAGAEGHSSSAGEIGTAFPPSPLSGEESGIEAFPPSPLVGEGPGMGGKDVEHWVISPELARAMTQVARELRKEPTPSEERLWQAIRKQQLDGRKFRRQRPIGPFVVDFYCPSERLIVEVDGPIHESQREADAQRQMMIESLGLRFVRVTAAQVEDYLPEVLHAIRAAFLPDIPHPQPLPHKEGGALEPGFDAAFPPSPLTDAESEFDAAFPPSPLSGEESGIEAFPPSPLVGEGPGMGGDHAAYLAISAAAKQLHEERAAWLNPPGLSGKALEQRTLTHLYNALLVFRGDPPAEGKRHPKIVPAAGDFAPRLADLHAALDRAVCAAYGWDHAVLDDEEEILRRLLALNLERAGQSENEN